MPLHAPSSVPARVLGTSPSELAQAAAALREGALVAFPTETVYGLGADAFDDAAVRRVFAAKGRPADNPLIVHLAAAEQLPRVAAEVTPLARELAARFWPGPLTVVLDALPAVPSVTTGGLTSVAVRVPGHPVARALLAEAGVPVAAPSANRSGRPSPTSAAHVVADDLDVAFVIDAGPCELGVESTVVDARGPQPVVLREGVVTREVLGVVGEPGDASLAASPGTRYRHYAPSCQVEIAPVGDGPGVAAALADEGLRVGLVAPARATDPRIVGVARPPEASALAAALFRALRDADDAGVDVLVVEAVEPVGVGRAVMDRLSRAAAR